MASVHITSAQPSPPGRDVARRGLTSNAKLNEEWVEFIVRSDRNMIGNELSHLTFNEKCRRPGGTPSAVLAICASGPDSVYASVTG